jgi:TolB-like protein
MSVITETRKLAAILAADVSVTAGLPVRVNAQLIDGAAGWANRFEENVADVFKLQDQAVARLAAETSARLMETKRSLLVRMAWY